MLGELEESETASILNAAVAIEASEIFDALEEHRRATVIDQIRGAAMKVKAWLPASEKAITGIQVVGQWTQDRELLLAATKAFGAINARERSLALSPPPRLEFRTWWSSR
jgi:hypothetical protein